MLLVHPIRGICRRVVAVAVAPFASRSTVIISRHGRLILNPPASIIQSRPTMGASCQESQSRSRSWSWLESRAGVRGAGHVWQPRVRFKVEVWKRKRKRKRCGSRSGTTLSLGIKQLIVERGAMQSRDRSYLCGPKGRAQRLLLSAWAEAVRAMHPVVRGWATTEVGWRMRGQTLRGKEASGWRSRCRSVQAERCRSVAASRVQLWPLCSCGRCAAWALCLSR